MWTEYYVHGLAEVQSGCIEGKLLQGESLLYDFVFEFALSVLRPIHCIKLTMDRDLRSLFFRITRFSTRSF